MAKGTFYVQFARRQGLLHALTITRRLPQSPRGGSVTVKLTVDIPDEAFAPLSPEATIEIPLERTRPATVAVDPLQRPAEPMLEVPSLEG
jgi:hypothetical protein